jgi:LDH2 family malate/lactate/ureidoglycolate dehydrogenase
MTKMTELDRPNLAYAAQRLRRIADMANMTYGTLHDEMAHLFRDLGMTDDDASLAAEGLLFPQLCGSDSHGMATLSLYVTGLLDRTIQPRPRVKVEQPMPTTLLIDAGHGLGLVESRKAMDRVIELAGRYGLGAAAVRNSSHFGAAGYYADLAARHGMIGLSFSNSAAAIAPTGGVTPLLGTNPIGAGAPSGDEAPMVLDMATATVARSRIRQMLSRGETDIPSSWALDADGQPTTDAAQAIAGSVLPIGGAKGYGLALLAELLCSALSDAEPGFGITYENVVKRPSGIGHFFLAINPAGFGGAEAFARRAGFITETIETSKPAVEGEPPRLPGRRAARQRTERMSGGIPITANLKAALTQTAKTMETYSQASAAS